MVRYLSYSPRCLFISTATYFVGVLILGNVFGIDGILYAGPVSSLLVGIMAIAFLARDWRGMSREIK